MNGTGGQILADTRFTGDQHRAVRRGCAQNLAAQLRHGRGIADQPVKAGTGGITPPGASRRSAGLKQQPHELPDHAEDRFGPFQQRTFLKRVKRHDLRCRHNLTGYAQRTGIVGMIAAVGTQRAIMTGGIFTRRVNQYAVTRRQAVRERRIRRHCQPYARAVGTGARHTDGFLIDEYDFHKKKSADAVKQFLQRPPEGNARRFRPACLS